MLLLNWLASFDEKVYILNDILVTESVKHIIKRTEIIQYAVFLKKTEGVFPFQVVFAFVSFKAKNLEMRRITHYQSLQSIFGKCKPAGDYLLLV